MEFVLYLWLLADTDVNYQSCVHVHRGLRVLEEIRGRNCRFESTILYIPSRLSDSHSYPMADVTLEVSGLRRAVRFLPLFVR